jgi:hypothetical protein
MGHADDVKRALSGRTRRTVAGHNFPAIGGSDADRLKYLEQAVAALANAVEIVGKKLDELENRAATYG